MLNRLAEMVDKLVVYPERMLTNLNMTRGVIFSQMVLLRLVDKGMSRENAYATVQKNAMQSWTEDKDFKQLLLEDVEVVSYLNAEEINDVFKIENFLRHTDLIFHRVFG
jgi:adenylosuccinate lyase